MDRMMKGALLRKWEGVRVDRILVAAVVIAESAVATAESAVAVAVAETVPW